MLTNKDIRVDNGNIVINGDKYPLDGQSPEAIMEIVEDNSDTTPTENSDAPITSGGVFTANKTISDTIGDITQTGVTGDTVADQIEAVNDDIASRAIIVKASSSDTKTFTIPTTVWADKGLTGSNHTAMFSGGYNGRISCGFIGTNGTTVTAIKLGDNTVTASISDSNIVLVFNDTVYTDLWLILFN